MAIRQILLTVFQTVLFVALFGCYAVNSAPAIQGEVSEPESVTRQQTEESKKGLFQSRSGIDASETESIQYNEDDAESQTETLESLEKEIKSARRHIVSLYVLLLAVIGGAYYLNKKWRHIQYDTDTKQNEKIKDLVSKVNDMISDSSSRLQQEMAELRKTGYKQANVQNIGQNQTNQTARTDGPGGGSTTPTTQGTQVYRETSNDTCKYFMLQESHGQLMVRDRNLKSEPNAWFSMEINGNRASYDINPKMIPVIMGDIATLKLCANNFEVKPNASSIKTLKKGTLQREGQTWVVTEKISIKLV